MKSETIAISMHNMQRKINPPLRMPAHAWICPVSLFLRMVFSEIAPYTKARNPSRKLGGKQIMLVNGKGAIPPQKKRTVRMPRIRLIMECRFVGGEGWIGSFDCIKMSHRVIINFAHPTVSP